MNINNDVGIQSIAEINLKDNVQKIKTHDESRYQGGLQKNIEKSPGVTISSQGKLNQEIDTTSDKIDDILLRHTTSGQKQELDEIYKKLDSLFTKDKLTSEEGTSVVALFEQVHVILETSLDKLTKSENETVDKLVNKMDVLTGQLDKNHPRNSLLNTPPINKTDITSPSSDSIVLQRKGSRKSLTVAEINALSVAELNKLTADQLKKLNTRQLNRLNASQLNRLDPAQLKKLSPNNVEKLNQSQGDKRPSI